MAKKIAWKPSPAVVRQQNQVKREILARLERAGNNNQEVDRSKLSVEDLRAIRMNGIRSVFRNPGIAESVFKEGSKLASRILNKMRDNPTAEGFIAEVNSRKVAGEKVDAVECLGHLEEAAIERGIFDSATEFYRHLENGGKGVSRLANDYNDGEITDEEALDRLNDQVINQLRKSAMEFDFIA